MAKNMIVKRGAEINFQDTFSRVMDELSAIAESLKTGIPVETVGDENDKTVFSSQIKPGNARVKEYRSLLALLGSLVQGERGNGGGRGQDERVNLVRDIWLNAARMHPAWTASPKRLAFAVSVSYEQTYPNDPDPVLPDKVERWAKVYNWESYLSLKPEEIPGSN